MNPELFSTLACALVIVWGAYSAFAASRSRTRLSLLGGLAGAFAMLLLVRLIAVFGGWTDWFVYLWLLAMIVYVVAVFRAAAVWPDLPWRAEEAKTRRSEANSLGVSGALVLTITGALVVPGFLLS